MPEIQLYFHDFLYQYLFKHWEIKKGNMVVPNGGMDHEMQLNTILV